MYTKARCPVECESRPHLRALALPYHERRVFRRRGCPVVPDTASMQDSGQSVTVGSRGDHPM